MKYGLPQNKQLDPLEQLIIEKIKKEGPITFETFMDIALYCPGSGYYSSGKTVIGRGGDFYTSPHLHPVFGAILAKLLMEMWAIIGKPPVFHAVEMGAGAGYLCRDILDYLHKPSNAPSLSKDKNDFIRSLRYVIVEPYEHFEKKQRDLLGDYLKCGDECPELVTWVKSLKEFPEQITGCIFSNELLDAFPVHLVEMEEKLKEIYVDFDGTEFVEVKGELSTPELTDYIGDFSMKLPQGYRTEINLRIRSWLEEINAALSRGFLLTIDYGYPAKEYYSEERTKGTLLCYHKHRTNENPYRNIGEQDITAHVNFSSLEKWGGALGLKTIGYCPQGTFLVSSGIDEVITELYPDSPDYLTEISKIKGLIFPQGMGETHNVMIQYKGEGLPELRGFSMRDRKADL
ncbi:MAG: class I SAM-dependent methyltransferase [Nitrospiraceae bacterium]|nr:MAG: class I SAM-dependent methyltransferase [Nitrospiraceae bacterium]